MKKTKKAKFDCSFEVFCPIKQTINLLGKRWTILIIKEIYYSSRKRLGFMDLRRKLPDVSTKVLSQRLKEMVKEGMLRRSVNSKKIPVRIRYSLTEKGEDACRIIEEFRKYGLKWGSKETFDCSKTDCELCTKAREAKAQASP
jgi:DNA-binding HxlR family transcriptional regulator